MVRRTWGTSTTVKAVRAKGLLAWGAASSEFDEVAGMAHHATGNARMAEKFGWI